MSKFNSGKSAPDGESEEVRAVVPTQNRYLKGLETTDSPKGMLPLYSSWSLLRTGAFGSYSELKGIEQPGFINRTNFLLRWEIRKSLYSPAPFLNVIIIYWCTVIINSDRYKTSKVQLAVALSGTNMRLLEVLDFSCNLQAKLFKERLTSV